MAKMPAGKKKRKEIDIMKPWRCQALLRVKAVVVAAGTVTAGTVTTGAVAAGAVTSDVTSDAVDAGAVDAGAVTSGVVASGALPAAMPEGEEEVPISSIVGWMGGGWGGDESVLIERAIST